MAETLGYMLTWTTYGTWLQGDYRGYVVKGGDVLREAKSLEQDNRERMVKDAVAFSVREQAVVRNAILGEADRLAQRIFALAVDSTHVHIVAGYTPLPIHKVAAYYKNAARQALKPLGRRGKIWTRGYDKRFCFDREAINRRIDYVRRHNKDI